MIKQVMTTGAADTICTDLTSTIKKKVKYSHKSSTGIHCRGWKRKLTSEIR